MTKFFNAAALCVVFCALFAGCSNYRLAGTPIDLPFKAVYVKPVRNMSLAPQAANLLTNAISDAISQTPDVRVANKDEADAVLETTIVGYAKYPYTTRVEDTALASSYKIVAVAKCTLSAGGRTIFADRKVEAWTIVYMPQANLLNNEYQNMPFLMRELGVKIKDAVIGIW